VAADFATRVREAAERNDSLLCVGLDPDLTRFPAGLRARHGADLAGLIAAFNRAVVEATSDLVCAYKPNLGFYLAYGLAGLDALARTRESIPRDIPVILDAKVNDIGHTATAYAAGYFGQFAFDAVTANAYLGSDSLRPFLAYPGRAVLVLCRNSNPSAGELQDLPVAPLEGGARPLYEVVARRIARWADEFDARGTCGAVVGATYPRELAVVRAILPDAPILIPGVGAQGGALAETVRAGTDARGHGAIVNASRDVTYASTGKSCSSPALGLEVRQRISTPRPRCAKKGRRPSDPR
jgi:orotidine-5'-phosphate decarboxylase